MEQLKNDSLRKPVFLLSSALALLVVGVGLLAMAAFLVVGVSAALGAELGSVSLAWSPVTENQDGTPINDLKDYRILKATGDETARSYDTANPAAIILAGTETHTFNDLPEGDHWWTVLACDTSDNCSVMSGEATKYIGIPPGKPFGVTVE